MEKGQLIKVLEAECHSKEIIKAFAKVSREKFISENLKKYAYENIALSLDKGSTISQPSTIAFMLSLLELKKSPKQKILEIGSGGGYVLALLSEINNGEIYGVEINKSLAEKSKKILSVYKNIKIFGMSGANGLPQYAPYDRIIVSATFSEIPNSLTKQLRRNGILVAPVNESIIKIKKTKGKINVREFPGFVFVPMR